MSERKHPRFTDRRGGARAQIAREAAELMLNEGVGQYLDAKRVAARRVLDGGRYRVQDLPANGEIRAALLSLVALSEGPDQDRRLFAMRVEALGVMRALDAFAPRLIGSVWSGHARRGSDIDVHVFGDPDDVRVDLDARGWAHDVEEVTIRAGSTFRTYVHLHLRDRPFPVELSVYPWSERRVVTRSSVDGRPIDRVSAARLEGLLRGEHPVDLAAWERTGDVGFTEGPAPGPFDGLVGVGPPEEER
jgi:hypothetical protein